MYVEPDFTDDDELIETQIAAAQAHAENYCSRPLGQTMELFLDGFGGPLEIEVYRDAAIAAGGITYLSAGETEYQPLDAGHYTFKKVYSGNIYQLKFKGDLPETEVSDTAVKVVITTTCPAPIKQAMLLLIGDMYQKHEDRGDVGYNSAATNLMRPYRKWA